MHTPTTILVVEDDPDIRTLLGRQLEQEGFRVDAVATGSEAVEAAVRASPAAIILDLMLPGLSGTEVCRRLRATPATARVPILILTARTDEVDRVVGFEVGADDYVTKPFSPRELALRVRALLRRATAPPPEPELHRAPGLTVDIAQHRVWVDAVEIQLTSVEFRLLVALARRRGALVTRAELLQDVWGMPVGMDSRTIDTHFRRLRAKLGRLGDQVVTVRGVGYRLATEVPA